MYATARRKRNVGEQFRRAQLPRVILQIIYKEKIKISFSSSYLCENIRVPYYNDAREKERKKEEEGKGVLRCERIYPCATRSKNVIGSAAKQVTGRHNVATNCVIISLRYRLCGLSRTSTKHERKKGKDNVPGWLLDTSRVSF